MLSLRAELYSVSEVFCAEVLPRVRHCSVLAAPGAAAVTLRKLGRGSSVPHSLHCCRTAAGRGWKIPESPEILGQLESGINQARD